MSLILGANGTDVHTIALGSERHLLINTHLHRTKCPPAHYSELPNSERERERERGGGVGGGEA